MTDLASLLPITVVSAIILFMVKEVIEGFRRSRSNQRKLIAIRKLMALECKESYDVCRRMRGILQRIKLSPTKLTVEKDPTGRFFMAISVEERGSSFGGRLPIPTASKSQADKYLMDAATLDAVLFNRMIEYCAGIQMYEHIRISLIDSLDYGNDPYFLQWVKETIEWTATYGLDEMDDIEIAIAALYLNCSGETLTGMN